MVDELGLRDLEQSRRLLLVCQVVVGAPGDEDLVTILLEAPDQVRSEEAAAAGDQDLHAGLFAGWSQSTRPIQRSRFSAYQRIVCSTPSSQLIFGSHPVSRFSFS